MKKIFFVLLMITAATLAFAQNGIIKEMTGDVKLKRAGASEFIPATAGDSVAPDTIVSIGFKSIAIIEVGSVTIVVKPLTQLSFAEIQTLSDTEDISLNLNAGRIKVDVKPPVGAKAKFSVQSPSAVASVRGTSFDFDTRNIKVHEGKVTFQGKKGMPRAVRTGSSSQVGQNGEAINPATINMDDLQPSLPVGADGNANTGALAPPAGGNFGVGPGYE